MIKFHEEWSKKTAVDIIFHLAHSLQSFKGGGGFLPVIVLHAYGAVGNLIDKIWKEM